MLNPEIYSLDATTVGFRKRMGLEVNWGAFNKALQTTDAVRVKRELEQTPISEIHVMGGGMYGIGNNMKTNVFERQQRQMNGYVLRAFSPDQPAVVLPKKYGGFAKYTPNATDREDFTSSFTEPMSAILQSNTHLLGAAGYSAQSHSASTPYAKLPFENLMEKSLEDRINIHRFYEEKKNAYIQSDMAKKRSRMQIGLNNESLGVSANGAVYVDKSDPVPRLQTNQPGAGFNTLYNQRMVDNLMRNPMPAAAFGRIPGPRVLAVGVRGGGGVTITSSGTVPSAPLSTAAITSSPAVSGVGGIGGSGIAVPAIGAVSGGGGASSGHSVPSAVAAAGSHTAIAAISSTPSSGGGANVMGLPTATAAKTFPKFSDQKQKHTGGGALTKDFKTFLDTHKVSESDYIKVFPYTPPKSPKAKKLK